MIYYAGVKFHGLKYFKGLLEPIPFLLPLNIIGCLTHSYASFLFTFSINSFCVKITNLVDNNPIAVPTIFKWCALADTNKTTANGINLYIRLYIYRKGFGF